MKKLSITLLFSLLIMLSFSQKRKPGKIYECVKIISSTPVYVDGVKMKLVKKELYRKGKTIIVSDTIPLTKRKVIKL